MCETRSGRKGLRCGVIFGAVLREFSFQPRVLRLYESVRFSVLVNFDAV